MNKRKWLKKSKVGHPRKVPLTGNGSEEALASHGASILSLLETINARLEDLAAMSKGLGCLEEFTKERLAAKSRDTLRVEGLKKLFRLACGNRRFVSMVEVDEGIYETLASIQRRMEFMANSIGKLLNDEGVRPIMPVKNDVLSESEHRIVQTVPPCGPDCLPGHVAECLEIGFAVQGVITPAEVTVFASSPESGDDNENHLENNQ